MVVLKDGLPDGISLGLWESKAEGISLGLSEGNAEGDALGAGVSPFQLIPSQPDRLKPTSPFLRV